MDFRGRRRRGRHDNVAKPEVGNMYPLMFLNRNKGFTMEEVYHSSGAVTW
jgi:hypothetical protein